MIVWEEQKDLTWEDFRQEPPFNYPESYKGDKRDFVAFTWGKTEVVSSEPVQVSSSKCQFQVMSINTVGIFLKPDSWVKPRLFSLSEGKQDDVLKHEQGHYDIIEIHARMAESDLLYKIIPCEEKEFDLEKAKHTIKKLSNRIGDKAQEMHDEYDDYTEHGEDEWDQGWWNTKISVLLDIHESKRQYYFVNTPPLKQIQNGTSVEEIKCTTGWIKIIKQNESVSSCVTPLTADKLEERGWGIRHSFLKIVS